MTPPDANITKQRKRHWPVFWGIVGALVLALLAWVALQEYTEDVSDPDVAGEAQETSDGN